MNYSELDARTVWHPYTQHLGAPQHLPIVRAKDALLWDENGREYIDFMSSWWVTTHAHCHPYIQQKIFEQCGVLDHAPFSRFTHPNAVQLAERLLELLPAF